MAQSDLPAPSVQEFESILKEAFREQGSLEYAERFSEFFAMKKILGAGTVGIAALRYILTSSSYDHVIPYWQRTQFGIALKASFEAGLSAKSLWTAENWDYFSHVLFRE